MPTIPVEQLTFSFPASWEASQFDEWSFYRNQFIRSGNARATCSQCMNQSDAGSRAIDILAIDEHKCCWLIEVKDYRGNVRTKVIDIPDEVTLKVRDSLATLAAARVNANDAGEKALAAKAMRCSLLRVVLHLEQPAKHSKLFPRAFDPSNVQQRLRQLVKSIDPHPIVTEMGKMNGIAWSVIYTAVP